MRGCRPSSRKMLKKTTEYEVGEVLVCQKYLKTEKCNVKFEYTVEAVSGNTIASTEGRNTKHVIHGDCRTCHSFQGTSTNDKITICDRKFFCVNRKWLYTAVTCATELSTVVFSNGPTEELDEATLNRC